jgi:dTDP-4-amino-4,6-dideoxygalactose transaminase
MSRDAWKRFEDSDKIHYTITEPGFKYNMMDIQAALGIHQLARVEKNWLRRAQIWAAYSRELADLPLTLPAPVARNTRHAYHLFTILIGEAEAGIDRDEFIRQMKKRLVSASVHYRSIPEFEYYQRRYGWRPQRWRNAAYIGRRTVSLPLSPRMTDADVESVIEATREILVGVRAARLPLPITAGSDTEARIEQGDYALLHHGD